MTLKNLLLFLLLALPFLVSAQLNFDWGIQSGSTSSDFVGSAFLDSEGNIWSFAEYTDTTDLDPGPDQDIIIPERSSFLATSSFDADGGYLHSFIFDAGQDAGGSLMEIKDDKMQFIIYFTDSLVFTFQGNSSQISSRPGKHIGLISISTEGQILKQHIFPQRHSFYISSLYTLDDESMIVGGAFKDTFSFNPGNSPAVVVSKGGYDALFARLDAGYNAIWMKTLGSTEDDYVENLSLISNKVYFTLIHEDTINVPTAGGTETFASNGKDNNVYGYFNLSGAFQKAFGFGGDLGDQIRTIAADSDGNMYVSGYFEGEVNFQHPSLPPVLYTAWNESDGFVSKYDSDGLLVWTRIIADNDYGGLYTMNLERGNELFLTGGFSEIADLDPGPDSMVVDGGYRGDLYMIKFNLDGELKWVYNFDGTSFSGIRSLLIGGSDKVYIQGYIFDSLDCDPGEGVFEIVTNGGSDFFMIGFSEENVISGTAELDQITTLIYPNPTPDEIQINCDAPIDRVILMTIDGVRLDAPTNNNAQGCSINLKDLAPGLYLVGIKSGDRQTIQKIIKQ